ncbi:MAG TPA: cytochrome P450 [Solirubrobacteraceae bacterium]|jgi:cytochrome P450|nr:cytochrome P450 [Solirubrobacteraceae bacterium]
MAASASVASTAEGSPGGAQTAAPAPAAAVPRGPRLPPLAQTLLWAISPTWVMDRCARALGEWFTITMWPSGMQLVLVSDPEALKALFSTPAEVAPSGAGNSPVAGVMGPSSLVTLTGPEHLRQRKLLLPPFHGERMREYEDVIVDATRKDMARWSIGEPMRLQERSRRITLEVILRAVFGVDAEHMAPMRAAVEGLFVPVNALMMIRIALTRPQLGRPTGSFGAALDRLDALIYDEIARRRASADLGARGDILSLLLQARDEDGEEMTDSELRDELVTLLLAGHETTATSVAWAIERLLRHPRVLERLVAEIDAGVADDYLGAVVHETLRARPVVPIVVRILAQDLALGDRVIPAGTRVAPAIWLTNRNPRIYDRPEEFRPERFLDGAPETFSWIPFGGGIRRCIGASFAMLEMKLILRTVLSELQPELPPRARAAGERVHRRAITLVPGDGARVVWRRRP